MATQQAKQQAVTALKALDHDEQREAVRSANPGLIPAGDSARTTIWVTLLIVLGIIAVVALVGSIYLAIKDKDGTAVIAVTSAVVAGALGLFASPPRT
jgi:hypothetical protein